MDILERVRLFMSAQRATAEVAEGMSQSVGQVAEGEDEGEQVIFPAEPFHIAGCGGIVTRSGDSLSCSVCGELSD